MTSCPASSTERCPRQGLRPHRRGPGRLPRHGHPRIPEGL